MTQDNDKIKELFAKELVNYEVVPPSGLWTKIAPGRRRRMIVLWRWAAAASVLLIAGFASLVYFTFQTSTVTLSEDAAIDSVTSGAYHTTQEDALTVAFIKREKPVITKLRQLAYRSIKSEKIRLNLPVSNSKAELYAMNNLPTTMDEWLLADSLEETEGEHNIMAESTVRSRIDLSKLFEWDSPGSKTSERWNLALGYGTNPAFAMPPNDYVIEETRSTFAHDGFSSDIAHETAYFEQIENTDHKFPVGIGLMAGFSLSKRWNVESGLLFTRLTTVNRTFTMNNMYREFETSIYYMGIPIGLRYNVFHKDNWKIYLSQSFIVEKGLRNRFTTYYYENEEEVNAEVTFAPVRGVQLSTLSHVGVDVSLTKHFSLYFQGGMQYFFLNETQPYTIRSTNPIWPSLQTGVRFVFQ